MGGQSRIVLLGPAPRGRALSAWCKHRPTAATGRAPGLAGRALGPWFAYSGDFRQLMVNAMSAGYSWARPGPGYLNIYEYIRHK
jgi:hypothetical protein